jgi:hypothetical protein
LAGSAGVGTRMVARFEMGLAEVEGERRNCLKTLGFGAFLRRRFGAGFWGRGGVLLRVGRFPALYVIFWYLLARDDQSLLLCSIRTGHGCDVFGIRWLRGIGALAFAPHGGEHRDHEDGEDPAQRAHRGHPHRVSGEMAARQKGSWMDNTLPEGCLGADSKFGRGVSGIDAGLV